MNRLLHDLSRRRGLSRRRAGVGAHLLWVRKLVARYRRVARRRSLVGLILAYHRTAGGDGATRPPGAMQLQLTIRRLLPRRVLPTAGAAPTRITVIAGEPGRVDGGRAQITTLPAPAIAPRRVLQEATAGPIRITTLPSRPGGHSDQLPQITTPPAPRLAPQRIRGTATAPTRIAVFPSRPGGIVDQPAQVTRSSVIRPVVIRPVVMRLPHVTQLTRADTAPAAAAITAAHSEPLLVAHQHIVQRVMSRGVRIESPPSRLSRTARQPSSTGVVDRASHPALEPVNPGVASRPLYALPSVGLSHQSPPATDTDRQSSDGWGVDPVRPQWGAVGPEHAQVDIERLADKVVSRINDRMIAHRERLGRI
jgi:hypothetical protein